MYLLGGKLLFVGGGLAVSAPSDLIADQSFSFGEDTGAGEWPYEFEADTGTITSVSLSGTNAAHFDASVSAGVVSISPSAAGVGNLSGPYSLTASFNGGASASLNIDTFAGRGMMDPAALAAAEVTSFVHKGQTVSLSAALPVLWSADNEPVIVATGASGITGFTTPSAHDGTYQRHGAMKFAAAGVDEYMTIATNQGFDELAEAGSRSYTYGAAKNVDPGANGGAPIAIAAGDHFTIIKSVGILPRPLISDDEVIEDYLEITVAPAWPTSGTWFRPAPTSGSKGPQWAEEDIDYTVLQSLTRHAQVSTAPTTFTNSYASFFMFGEQGEAGRRLMIGATYSEGLAVQLWLELFALHSTDSTTDKRNLACRVIQRGIDVLGLKQAGYAFGAGAGQWSGYIHFLFYAGFLLQDDLFLTTARATRSNEVRQYHWPTAMWVNYPQEWPSDAPRDIYDWFHADHLGMPTWAKEVEIGTTDADLDTATIDWETPYRSNNTIPVFRGNLAVGLLQNGPNGRTGWGEVVGGAGYGTDSPYAAALMHLDWARPWMTLDAVGGHIDAASLYDYYRGNIPEVEWTGPNQAWHLRDAVQCSVVTAGSSSVAWNMTGKSTATEAHVQWDVGISFDGGYQFRDVEDAGISGSFTSLVPAHQYIFRFREETTPSGKGGWSPTWAYAAPSTNYSDNADIIRGIFTPTGTEDTSSAPTNTHAPKVLLRPYPEHPMPYYEDAPSTLDQDEVEVYAGGGEWSVPIDSYAFQWQESADGSTGWSNISGATTRNLSLVGLDGQFVRCVVTATGNAQNTAANSNVVGVPAALAAASGALIDTSFLGRAAHTYATQLASLEMIGAATSGNLYSHTLAHKPKTPDWDGNFGALVLYKAGIRPDFRMELGTAPAGDVTYNFEIDIAISGWKQQAQTANFQYSFESGDRTPGVNPTKFWKTLATVAPGSYGTVQTISGSFTVASGDVDRLVHLYFKVDGASGGQTGGHGMITRLVVEEAP